MMKTSNTSWKRIIGMLVTMIVIIAIGTVVFILSETYLGKMWAYIIFAIGVGLLAKPIYNITIKKYGYDKIIFK